MIRLNSTGVQKPKCPSMSSLSTNSNPPGSAPAVKKTVTSCQICNQLFMAKNIASTHSKQRVPPCLPSTFYESKNLNVLLWQDYQELPISTVWASHYQDSSFVSQMQSIVFGENQSFYTI